MQDLCSRKAQARVGVSALVCQAAMLWLFTRGLHLETTSYLAKLVGGGGFLAAGVAVFPAWAVGGPLFGVPAVALALGVNASTQETGLALVKAISLILPVGAAIAHRRNLLEIQNRQRRTQEEITDELARLEDGTAQKQARLAALGSRVDRAPLLRRACQALGAALEVDQVEQVIVREAVTVLENAQGALVFLVSDDPFAPTLRAVYPLGVNGPLKACPTQEADRFVFERGKPYLCSRTSADIFRFSQDEPGPVASFASAPIWVGSSSDAPEGQRRCVGVLRVTSPYDDALGRSDMEMLNIIATLAGMSLQNAYLYHRCKELAITDTLTELYSPYYFRERFNEELTRSAREHASLSFLMMDIDNFKAYNDTYGHPAGDSVLQQIAHVLKSQSQSGDILVRYGGEEFVAFRQTDYAGAKQWAESIRAAVAQAQIGTDVGSPPITMSLGVGAYPTNGVEMEEIIEYADKAMYRAKEAGKNQVC